MLKHMHPPRSTSRKMWLSLFCHCHGYWNSTLDGKGSWTWCLCSLWEYCKYLVRLIDTLLTVGSICITSIVRLTKVVKFRATTNPTCKVLACISFKPSADNQNRGLYFTNLLVSDRNLRLDNHTLLAGSPISSVPPLPKIIQHQHTEW